MIVKFQAKLSNELQFQTQEATSSGAEVDEHAITRRVLGERRGHVRAVDRKLKGVGTSTTSTAASHAHFASGSSSFGPSHDELVAARAESQMYKQMLEIV